MSTAGTREAWNWKAIALVAVVSSAPFLPGVTAPFITWDDPYYVTASDHVHAGGVQGFLGLLSYDTALRDKQIEFFPVRDSVNWVLWHTFGKNPIPFHLTTLALHTLVALLVRALALRLGFSSWVATTAALLFGTYPVHVESVTWVSALKDPLFLSLLLGSLIAFLRYRESAERWQYVVSLFLLAGALLSKSLALPGVVLLAAAERWVGTPTAWPRIARRLAVPLAMTAWSLATIVSIGRATQVVTGPHGGGWPAHWQLMGWSLTRYVQQAFVPLTFRLHYCFPAPAGLTDPRLWATVLALPAVTALGWWAWKRDRRLAFLWFWFFACLAPVANVIPFPSLMADRYLYSATVASALAMAWALERVQLRLVLVAALVLAFAGITATRAAVWQDQEQLWEDVGADPACWQDESLLALNALSEWASHLADPKDALAAYQRIERHPGFARLDPGKLCGRFYRSVLGAPQPDPGLERAATQVALSLCPDDLPALDRLARAQWTFDPPAAVRALARIQALAPSPLHQWQVGLALFNSHSDDAPAAMASAVQADPKAVCPGLRQWAASLSDTQRPMAEPLLAQCP